jgi:hypothetical protein
MTPPAAAVSLAGTAWVCRRLEEGTYQRNHKHLPEKQHVVLAPSSARMVAAFPAPDHTD